MPVYNRIIKRSNKWTRNELYVAFMSLVHKIPRYQLKDWFEEVFGLEEEENEKEE